MNSQELEHCKKQQHVHEITGITLPGSENQCIDCHNHLFATVSGEAIPIGQSHVHEIEFRTDFADDHYHTFCGKSGLAINVGQGKHVHYVKACTQSEDGHKHAFQVASLIEEPTEFEHCSER